jgi:hypothetical protein
MNGRAEQHNPDILFQDDGDAGACTGFMVMRPNARVLEYWRKVAEWMRDTNQLDQDAANRLLETHFALVWGLLPERYWTVGRNSTMWNPGDQVAPVDSPFKRHFAFDVR